MSKTDPELLLDLADEYRLAMEARESWSDLGIPAGREPAAIAAEHAEVLRRVVRA